MTNSYTARGLADKIYYRGQAEEVLPDAAKENEGRI